MAIGPIRREPPPPPPPPEPKKEEAKPEKALPPGAPATGRLSQASPVQGRAGAAGSFTQMSTRPPPVSLSPPPVSPEPPPSARPGVTADVSSVRVPPAATSPGYPAALSTQRDLSQARQNLGKAQLDPARANDVPALSQKVQSLEAVETSQPKGDVEMARFAVFKERLAAVEQEQGKSAAALLGRQTYYNSFEFSATMATRTASEGEINAAGFPRGEPVADGFNGAMRTLDGHPVDMGHVMCGLDYQVNEGRMQDAKNNGDLIAATGDLGMMTLTGDLANVTLNTSAGSSLEEVRQSFALETEADLTGDVDAINLAAQISQRPNESMSSIVDGYYRMDQPTAVNFQNRKQLFVDSAANVGVLSRWKPTRGPDGALTFDESAASDTIQFNARLIKTADALKGDGLGDIFGSVGESRLTAQVFKEWLQGQIVGINNE